MTKLAVVVALFALIGIAAAASSFSFSGNVTLTEQQDFSYRQVSMGAWNLINLWSGAWYASVEAKASGNTGSLDSLWGSAYTGLGNFPVTTLAYFNVDAQFSNVQNWAQLDVSGSAGFIANSYVALTEKDSNGNVVVAHSLKEIVWSLVDQGSNGGLHWATFRASKSGKFTVTLTYFASEVVGTVDIAGTTVVTPRTLESVFAVQDYQYTNNANTVTLTLGVASGSASAAASGQITIGSGNEQMYLVLATEALVGASLKPVSISAFASASLSANFNNDIVTQVTGKFGGAASAQIVNITFPAGATSFEYDPTIGNGPVPQVAGGIQSAPALILMAAVMAIKLLL
eukprot:TRINITY_DN6560_c0_g1_i1.p1 TRINITY_DN6560_c0_g1~~TRINITY_DN6560_c0_g1_i1.p1  ORF type:complete len:351 (+),score=104.89 TRINITY_DN6560_c0_g1_i1:22-1053(+)